MAFEEPEPGEDMMTVRIDREVALALRDRAYNENDTPNKVLRRMLGLPVPGVGPGSGPLRRRR